MSSNFHYLLKETLEPLKNKHIAFAVSSGVDSVVLFHSCLSLLKRFQFKPFLFHILHHIRPQEEQWESLFLKRLAQHYRTPFLEASIQTTSPPLSLTEDQLRNLRYSQLFSLATNYQIEALLMGHHKDDSQENFLIRLFQGSDLFGLKPLKTITKRSNSSPPIIRPFVKISKKKIYQYAISHQLSYYQDSTNRSNLYQRNYIRNILIPQVGSHFKRNIPKTISQTAQRHEQIAKEIEIETHSRLKSLMKKKFSTLYFRKKEWIQMRPFWQDMMIRFLLLNEFKSNDGLNKNIRHNLIQYIHSHSTNKTLFKRSQWVCQVEYGSILFSSFPHLSSPLPFTFTPFYYTKSCKEFIFKKIHHSSQTQIVSLSHPHLPIQITPYRAQQEFHPSHLKGKQQNLNKFLNKKKYPHLWRSSIPLLTYSKGQTIALISIDIDYYHHAHLNDQPEHLLLIQIKSNKNK